MKLALCQMRMSADEQTNLQRGSTPCTAPRPREPT